jgi:hypothetical protein
VVVVVLVLVVVLPVVVVTQIGQQVPLRSHALGPLRPQLDRAAQLTTAPRHCVGTSSFAALVTHRTYFPWPVASSHGQRASISACAAHRAASQSTPGLANVGARQARSEATVLATIHSFTAFVI